MSAFDRYNAPHFSIVPTANNTVDFKELLKAFKADKAEKAAKAKEQAESQSSVEAPGDAAVSEDPGS